MIPVNLNVWPEKKIKKLTHSLTKISRKSVITSELIIDAISQGPKKLSISRPQAPSRLPK
jgi:hypothetical protein